MSTINSVMMSGLSENYLNIRIVGTGAPGTLFPKNRVCVNIRAKDSYLVHAHHLLTSVHCR